MYRMCFALAERGDHLLEIQLQSMKSEWQETVNAPWADWLPQIQCKTLAGFGDSLENINTSLPSWQAKEDPSWIRFHFNTFPELHTGKGPCVTVADEQPTGLG